MNTMVLGIIGFAIMLLLIFFGTPVGISLALTGIVGFAIYKGIPAALYMGGLVIPDTLSDFTFLVVPAFLLMGEFADVSGIMRGAYDSANKWLGNIPGGLAMASILGAAAFSAVSGSSMACVIIMSRVALPTLLDHGYSPSLVVGTLASGGTLGNLIPPGVLLVIYALLAQVSVGKMFIACIIPGFLLAAMYMLQIYIQCRIKPSLGPRAFKTPMKEKIYSTKDVIPLMVVFVMFMGGMLIGIFTAFEAAAVGTVIVFLYALLRKNVTRKNTIRSFENTIVITGLMFAIIIGARIFTSFIALSGLTDALANWVVSLNVSPTMVVVAIMVVYFIIGTAMDSLTMLLLTLPVFIVIVQAMNINLIWFGVLVIVQMELANLTPPIGFHMFSVAAMVKDRGITMNTIYKGVLPFCVTCLTFNLLLVAFPQLVLWLVDKMA